jgi:selenocysteine-specific elongation factor
VKVIRVIVGTAGHVDHGKTSLIKALAGVDCDRWAEEKARGITIDLGFAHLTVDGVQFGFVDVPGHERFLHNALAGLGGIRVVLLVIAADERIKAQTREHLAVCELLKIPSAVVALTKIDLMTAESLQLAQLEVEEFIGASAFVGAPIVPVSSKTGEGLTALKDVLRAKARDVDSASLFDKPARLPIDRAFHLKGLGVIITGTLMGGMIRPGDALDVLPRGHRCRVRNVHVHNRPRECAFSGERVSLQLSGVELQDASRGMQLAARDVFRPVTRAVASISMLPDMPPVSRSTLWRLYLHSADVVCKVRPLERSGLRSGQEVLVELIADEPIVAVRGDRFVLRHAAAQATVAGGVILMPLWQPPGRRRSLPACPPAEASRPDVLLAWIHGSGECGVYSVELAARLGVTHDVIQDDLDVLERTGQIYALTVAPGTTNSGRWVSVRSHRAVMDRVESLLRELERSDDLGRGLAKSVAMRRLFPGMAARSAELYLAHLAERRVIGIDRDRVTLPGQRVLTAEESALAATVLEKLSQAGLRAPSYEELCSELHMPVLVIDPTLKHLEERGRVVRMSQGLLCEAGAVSRLRDELRARNWERFTVPQFKEHFGLSRKWAIPLLEYLDSVGVTQRSGDARLLI